MSLYSIALFVHVVGALLLFALLAVEGYNLRDATGGARLNRILGPISLVAILLPGLYMAATGPGWAPWAGVGLVSYVLIAAVGAYTGISVMRGRMAPSAAAISWLARTGIALGVVFDMTVKPGLVGSITAVVVAVAIALIAAVPSLRAVRPA